MDSSLPIKTIRKSSFYLTVLSMTKHISSDDKYRESLLLLPLVGLCVGATAVILGYFAYVTVGWPLHCIFAVATSTFLTAGLYYKDCIACLDYFDSDTAPVLANLLLLFSVLIKIGVMVSLGADWWLAALFAPMLGRLGYVYSRLSYSEAEKLQLASIKSIIGIAAPLLLGLAVIKAQFVAIVLFIALGMFGVSRMTPFKDFQRDHLAQASGVYCEGIEVLSMLLIAGFADLY